MCLTLHSHTHTLTLTLTLITDTTFGGVLFASLQGNLRHWASKKGAAFVVAALVESGDKELATKVKCFMSVTDSILTD